MKKMKVDDMTRLLRVSVGGSLLRHAGIALASGVVGGVSEWAGMPPDAVGLLVVLTAVTAVTAVFFRASE